MIDEIWNTYDVDNDGVMTDEEVEHFVKEYMPEFKPGFIFSQDLFVSIFKEIDEDDNSVVDRNELTEFIFKLLNHRRTENEIDCNLDTEHRVSVTGDRLD